MTKETAPVSPSTGQDHLRALLKAQQKAQGSALLAAAVTASLVSAAAVLLLGLSGWFLAAAALAGLAGPIVASTFNYLIPSSLIRFLAVVRTASRYGERITGHQAALRALANLRPRLFEGLAGGPVERTLALSGGEASSRLVQDVDAIQNHFVRLSAPWGAISGLVAGMAMALVAGWKPAVVILVAVLAGTGISIFLARRLADPAGRQVQQASGLVKSDFAAMAAAAAELQAYGARDWATAQVGRQGQQLDAATRRLTRAGSALMATQTATMALTVIGVVLTGPANQPPLMALAILAAITTIESSAALMTALRQRGAVATAVERLGSLLDSADQATGQPTDNSLTLVAPALTLNPPQRLAISGRSGLGKTTLIERWMHLRPAIKAETRLGGLDVADVAPRHARARFAYAPQQATLLAGTVRENLRLADPKADDTALWAALKAAALDERIARSALGLDTPLGENGTRLSGGERRRLGLARAYLRQAPWLVLDEPTEGLDPVIEARVLEGLEAHLQRTGQGLILVSHRPAPLALCDHHIAVLGRDEDGRIQMSQVPSRQAA